MYKKPGRFLFVPLAACFCTVAFSSPWTDQTGDPAWFDVVGGRESLIQQPLLLAKVEKVDICHFLSNGKFITQNLPVDTARKLIDEDPDMWVLGKCDDVISPS